MAHERERRLAPILLSDLKWSPAVGIFGLRQVGKTTLMHSILKKHAGEFASLDEEALRESAQNAPREFCERKQLFCIDEAQKAPRIFPVIKSIVGTKRKPGQFFLTGSIRFTLKKEVKEALTGRIVLHELLPFNISEIHQIPDSEFLKTCFTAAAQSNFINIRDQLEVLFARSRNLSDTDINIFFQHGGLPLSCFTRDAEKRLRWIQGYFETLITRDLPLVDETLNNISVRQGLAYLHALAVSQGKERNINDLASASAMTADKARRILIALEALSLIDLIFPELLGQKAKKKPRIEWKDIGLWQYLYNGNVTLDNHPQAMQLLIAQELRTQASLMVPEPAWTYYQSRDGASIPWVYKRHGMELYLIYVHTEAPSPYDYRMLKASLEGKKNALGIVLGSRKAPVTALGEHIWLVPYRCIF